MSKQQVPLIIRDASAEDVPFIFSSWLKSFRNGAMCRHVDNTIYYAEHHKVCEKLMKRCKILIAADANDVANILGWICYEEIDGIFTLHYAYTKHTFRGLGVLRQIFNSIKHDFNTAGIHTHMTEAFKSLAYKYNLVYHPYVLVNDTQSK
jgi:hypothetical protein